MPPQKLQTVPSREEIIDEFGELDRRLALVKPAVDRHKVLKETIAGWYADTPAEQAAIAQGGYTRSTWRPRAMSAPCSISKRLFRR